MACSGGQTAPLRWEKDKEFAFCDLDFSSRVSIRPIGLFTAVTAQ
jgi:hypothetical protein